MKQHRDKQDSTHGMERVTNPNLTVLHLIKGIKIRWEMANKIKRQEATKIWKNQWNIQEKTQNLKKNVERR